VYDDVLLPTDGSDGIGTVLDHALALAGPHDATVHACYVIDTRIYRAAPPDRQDDVLDGLRAEGEAAVERIRAAAADAGLEAVTALERGTPSHQLTEYVADEGIDVVVMGTHGRTGRERLATLGSVTERVLKGVEVPVFVIDIGNAGGGANGPENAGRGRTGAGTTGRENGGDADAA